MAPATFTMLRSSFWGSDSAESGVGARNVPRQRGHLLSSTRLGAGHGHTAPSRCSAPMRAEASVFIGPKGRGDTGLSHALGRLEVALLGGALGGGEAGLHRLVPLPARRHIAQHGHDTGHLPWRLFDKDDGKFEGNARAVFPYARHSEELPGIGVSPVAITR
jgi:hypothetical protein